MNLLRTTVSNWLHVKKCVLSIALGTFGKMKENTGVESHDSSLELCEAHKIRRSRVSKVFNLWNSIFDFNKNATEFLQGRQNRACNLLHSNNCTVDTFEATLFWRGSSRRIRSKNNMLEKLRLKSLKCIEMLKYLLN